MNQPLPTDLIEYYALRAQEYDDIYDKPERQTSISRLRKRLETLLAGHDVLEVACGTGYWTQWIAQRAQSILATDINEQMLTIARGRLASNVNVRLAQDDAYRLTKVRGPFSAGFAGFWWSHVDRQNLGRFLNVFHSRLEPGALVIFTDNHYIHGSSSPITREDKAGNTYQRRLYDGSEYEILKNFPEKDDFYTVLADRATNLKYELLHYYWLLSYNVAN